MERGLGVVLREGTKPVHVREYNLISITQVLILQLAR